MFFRPFFPIQADDGIFKNPQFSHLFKRIQNSFSHPYFQIETPFKLLNIHKD